MELRYCFIIQYTKAMSSTSVYVGRIVALGLTNNGNKVGVYRVSSQSFPNRSAKVSSDKHEVQIVSRPGSEDENSRSPYVAYACVRLLDDFVVISNGTHTDLIAEKLRGGMKPEDALQQALAELGYEKDDHSTPRIAGVLSVHGDNDWLGVARKDALAVQKTTLQRGKLLYISTYERNGIDPSRLLDCNTEQASQIAQEALDPSGSWSRLSNPVTATSVVIEKSGTVDLAVADYK